MTRITGATILLPAGLLSNQDLSSNAAIDTSKIAQRVLAEYPVPFSSLRVWDAVTSLPVSAAANDDLGLINGTFGTHSLLLRTGDLKAAGSTSRKIRFEVAVPPNYDDGQTIQIRVRAGMETTVADTAATIDLEVYKPDGDGLVGSDLCATSATSVNSLTKANVDFSITASSVDPSDRLECVLTFLVNDAATVTAVQGVVTDLILMCDTRG